MIRGITKVMGTLFICCFLFLLFCIGMEKRPAVTSISILTILTIIAGIGASVKDPYGHHH